MKKIFIVILFLGVLSSCIQYQESVGFHWYKNQGTLLVNGEEVTGESSNYRSPFYVHIYFPAPEGDEFTVEFLPGNSKGWSFDHWKFSYNDDLVTENPFTFNACLSFQDVYLHSDRYQVEDFVYSADGALIFFSVLYQEQEYGFLFECSTETLTPYSAIQNGGYLVLDNRTVLQTEKNGTQITTNRFNWSTQNFELLDQHTEATSAPTDFLWSPNGEYTALLIAGTNTSGNAIQIYDRSSGKTGMLQFGTENKIDDLSWSQDSSQIYFTYFSESEHKKWLCSIETADLLLANGTWEKRVEFDNTRAENLTGPDIYGDFYYINKYLFETPFPEKDPYGNLYHLDPETGTCTKVTEAGYKRLILYRGNIYTSSGNCSTLLAEGVFSTETGVLFSLDRDYPDDYSTIPPLIKSDQRGAQDLYLSEGLTTRITTPERILPLLESGE